MPFVSRQVDPIQLAGRPLPYHLDNPLECVSNQTLCDAMRQLSSLLRHADTLFSDLESQCGKLTTRTKGLTGRIVIIAEKVEKFDPKKEKIPCGDLVSFSRLKSHFATSYTLTDNIFNPESRPTAVNILYEEAKKHNNTG